MCVSLPQSDHWEEVLEQLEDRGIQYEKQVVKEGGLLVSQVRAGTEWERLATSRVSRERGATQAGWEDRCDGRQNPADVLPGAMIR